MAFGKIGVVVMAVTHLKLRLLRVLDVAMLTTTVRTGHRAKAREVTEV
jgi:hypothetical protein